MNREALIHYIKSNDIFYRYVNFAEHSEAQLLYIKLRIEKEAQLNGIKPQAEFKYEYQ